MISSTYRYNEIQLTDRLTCYSAGPAWLRSSAASAQLRYTSVRITTVMRPTHKKSDEKPISLPDAATVIWCTPCENYAISAIYQKISSVVICVDGRIAKLNDQRKSCSLKLCDAETWPVTALMLVTVPVSLTTDSVSSGKLLSCVEILYSWFFLDAQEEFFSWYPALRNNSTAPCGTRYVISLSEYVYVM